MRREDREVEVVLASSLVCCRLCEDQPVDCDLLLEFQSHG